MSTQQMDIRELGHMLVAQAYPEFKGRDVKIIVGNLRSYGQVRWSNTGEISIICHRDVISWPEPAIIGLLAHEFSHPAKGQNSSEEETDFDVIERGLGPYLAVERAYVNKYEDHRVSRGRDRYLGFQSINGMLNDHEKGNMAHLLEDFNILRLTGPKKLRMIHDTSIHDATGESILMIEGQTLKVEGAHSNSDLKLLFREGTLLVYLDDEVAARVPWTVK